MKTEFITKSELWDSLKPQEKKIKVTTCSWAEGIKNGTFHERDLKQLLEFKAISKETYDKYLDMF